MDKRQLNAQRMQPVEYTRTTYDVVLEVGTELENLLDEGYWAHVAAKLKPWDRIEARAEDGSHLYELVVLAAGRNFARVKVLEDYELDVSAPGEAGIPSDCEVEWAGPHAKWRVKRGPDVLKDKFESRAMANQWLVNRAKAA